MARRPAVLALALLAAALAAWTGAARAEEAPPAVTLLSPADDAREVVSAQLARYPTLRFRVDYATPGAADRLVHLDLAGEPAFVRQSTETFLCPAGRTSCELVHTARTPLRPGERLFWRVRAGSATSTAWSLVALAPPDRDRDSVPDEIDNCPARANRGQEDVERDGKGDACQPDRRRPRVKAYAGSARIGFRATFRFRVEDNRRVDVRATVRWQGRLALSGRMDGVLRPRWRTRVTWSTAKPIGLAWPLGTYEFCVVAVDRAGNRARSCAPYRIG